MYEDVMPQMAGDVVGERLREDGNPPGRLSWMKQGPECRGEGWSAVQAVSRDNCQLAIL